MTENVSSRIVRCAAETQADSWPKKNVSCRVMARSFLATPIFSEYTCAHVGRSHYRRRQSRLFSAARRRSLRAAQEASARTARNRKPAEGARARCHDRCVRRRDRRGGVDSTATAAAVKAAKSKGKAAAQVTCTDGTMSKGGQGACSGHGGIKKAADTTKAAAKKAPAPPAKKP